MTSGSDNKELLARADALEAAIRDHWSQRADDRCFFDDDRLYAAAGLPPCDRRVGNPAAMLKNCERYIANRCEAGGWPSYVELEAERDRLAEWKQSALSVMPDYQEIGKLLKVPLGESIHDKIVPAIRALLAKVAENESLRGQLAEANARLAADGSYG